MDFAIAEDDGCEIESSYPKPKKKGSLPVVGSFEERRVVVG